MVRAAFLQTVILGGVKSPRRKLLRCRGANKPVLPSLSSTGNFFPYQKTRKNCSWEGEEGFYHHGEEFAAEQKVFVLPTSPEAAWWLGLGYFGNPATELCGCPILLTTMWQPLPSLNTFLPSGVSAAVFLAAAPSRRKSLNYWLFYKFFSAFCHVLVVLWPEMPIARENTPQAPEYAKTWPQGSDL